MLFRYLRFENVTTWKTFILQMATANTEKNVINFCS